MRNCKHDYGEYGKQYNSTYAREYGNFGDYHTVPVVRQDRVCKKCGYVWSQYIRDGKVEDAELLDALEACQRENEHLQKVNDILIDSKVQMASENAKLREALRKVDDILTLWEVEGTTDDGSYELHEVVIEGLKGGEG